MPRLFDPCDRCAAWVRIFGLVLVVIALAAPRADAQSATPDQTPNMVAPTAQAQTPTDTNAAPAAPVSAPEAADTRRFPLQAFWDNGLHFDSIDDQFHLHLGGRGQVDSTWLIGPQSIFTTPSGSTSGVGNAAGALVRRAVLQADGDIFGQFDYFVQFDFANASNDNSGEEP